MKTRLKTYIVTIAYSHESYNGYDHNDEPQDFEVKAINRKVAGCKGLQLARKSCGGYSTEIQRVQNKNDDTDWIFYV